MTQLYSLEKHKEMGYHKRYVSALGILSAFKNSGFSGVKQYFSSDTITGIKDNKFTGDVYAMMCSSLDESSDVTPESITNFLSHHLKRYQELILQSKELSREYINQSESAQQSHAYQEILSIDKEIGYYA